MKTKIKNMELSSFYKDFNNLIQKHKPLMLNSHFDATIKFGVDREINLIAYQITKAKIGTYIIDKNTKKQMI